MTRCVRYLLNILIPVFGWLLAVFLGPRVLGAFMPFVTGWILASMANPLVRFLEKHLKILRKHSSVAIVVMVLAGVIGLSYLLVSRMVLEAAGLVQDIPQLYEMARTEVLQAFSRLSYLFVRFPLGIQDMFYQFWSNLGGYLSHLVQSVAQPTVAVAGNVAKQIPAIFVNIIITVLSSYFFIAEQEDILKKIKQHMPLWMEQYLLYLKGDARHLIGGYFLAQFKIMFVVALVLAAGFLVLGVEHSLIFAALIAFLDFLPMLGTGTILGPWALVKLLSGEYPFAAGLVLLYILTQVIRQIIQPKIVGDAMGLPPLLTLFLLYIGFKVRGIAGMILAVPVGLLFFSFYKHGAFDAILENGRLLLDEISDFRHNG